MLVGRNSISQELWTSRIREAIFSCGSGILAKKNRYSSFGSPMKPGIDCMMIKT